MSATRNGSKVVRIGGATASFSDTALSVPQLLEGGSLDYLIFDYLAEGSMGIFGRMQADDPAAGYGTDFLTVHVGPHLREIAAQGIKVVANAGGVNPAGLAEALEKLIAEAGLDLTVHKDLGAYRGWVSYSYGIVNHVDATGTLNGGNPYPALQDQRHEINLVQLYSVGAWNFSSTLMYGSGRPYTPPTVNAMGQETVLNPRGVNSERLPAYFRLDLAAQWGFRWKSLEGTLGASVYNVTDHYNIQSRIYGLRAEELQSGDQGPQDLRWEVTPLDAIGLGITPNVFLNLQF